MNMHKIKKDITNTEIRTEIYIVIKFCYHQQNFNLNKSPKENVVDVYLKNNQSLQINIIINNPKKKKTKKIVLKLNEIKIH